MFTIKSNPARAVLTGLFWDPFDVARAITALIRDGFSEYEIDAIGVLCGRAPDLTDLLFSMGLEGGRDDFLQRLFCRWSYVAHRPHGTRTQSEDCAEYAEAARVYRSGRKEPGEYA
jgi:hypothetical protein